MKVLLIWEQIPSSTKAFQLDVDETELEILERAHRHYLCTELSDDRKNAIRSIRARVEPEHMNDIDMFTSVAGLWHNAEMKGNSIHKAKKLYISGVMG
jgi:hypothetical protein